MAVGVRPQRGHAPLEQLHQRLPVNQIIVECLL